jgi:hypothetical protein
MGFQSLFIKMDVFKKIPKDLTEPTFFGALGTIFISTNSLLVSFICTFILAFLCYSEFQSFFKVDTKTDMLVDIQNFDEKMNINIDILFNKMPCDLLSLDV